MSLHIHHLRGCAPAPLAHYLKALGVLRLVSEQADPQARLWWQDEHACFATTLDEGALIAFFADRYEPTPMIAPWNGGSGFYPKDNRVGPDGILAQTHPRFATFQAAIRWGRTLVGGRDESPKDEAKAAMIATCRASWRGGLARWLATAVVLDQDLTPKYPALLGTGGNDGRLDFTNNLMQRWVELIESDGTASKTARLLLRAAISGIPAPGLAAG
ncbi:MAG: type CRISPR-associated protein Csx17, partial [Planctomycetota bacterium]